MISMNAHVFSDFSAARPEAAAPASPAWHLLPLEGRFELVYEDGQGVWSRRTVAARELKLGPGRTLLGGIDPGRGGYRGFRVDRIRRLTDTATGERLEGGILDWLMARAEAQRRESARDHRRRTRAQTRARREAALERLA
jgi:predicted DNA-binding transcriptional regulator YafY